MSDIARRKLEMVQRIQKLMRPNTYADYHDIWARNRNVLMEMSYSALNDLYALLLCRNVVQNNEEV